MSFIESGHSEIVMNKIKKSLVRNHSAFVYEDVCKERMWELNAEDAWPFNFTKLGRYWDARTEIDIAALDPEEKNLILGECKYWQEPVERKVGIYAVAIEIFLADQMRPEPDFRHSVQRGSPC